jgi:hypothetical protein
MIAEAMAAAGLAAGLLAGAMSVWLHQRGRMAGRRELEALRAELARVRVDSLAELGRLGEEFEGWKRDSQRGVELCEGQLSVTARSRALRMLRAGVAADAVAGELGMGRSEVELLRDGAGVLAGRG